MRHAELTSVCAYPFEALPALGGATLSTARSPLARLFGRDPVQLAAHAAYIAVVDRARAPAFYAEHGVPDSVDGRFELIALHAFLVLHRIKGVASAAAFGQSLFDVMFADMDRGLREMGTGDLTVGKQVKRMATAFYGRAAAYQAGLDGAGDLADGLRRNLFGTVAVPDEVAIAWFMDYLGRQVVALDDQPVDAIAAGIVAFGPLEAAA